MKDKVKELKAKIRDISDDIDLCNTIVSLEDSESWVAFKAKIEEGIEKKKESIISIPPALLKDNFELIHESLIEINILQDVMNITKLYNNRSIEKNGVLAKLKNNLKSIINRKKPSDRMRY